jgi:hypothetical protein
VTFTVAPPEAAQIAGADGISAEERAAVADGQLTAPEATALLRLGEPFDFSAREAQAIVDDVADLAQQDIGR